MTKEREAQSDEGESQGKQTNRLFRYNKFHLIFWKKSAYL